MIFVTETWFNKNDPDHNFTRNNTYEIFRKDRKSSNYGGGVAIFASSVLMPVLVEFEMNERIEGLWVQLRLNDGSKLYVGCFYKPHREDTEVGYLILDHLASFISKFTPSKMIITGDYNLPT